MRGHIASQSPAISRQPPREFDEISISLLVSHLAPRNHRNLWRNRSKIDLGRGSRAPKIKAKLNPEPSEQARGTQKRSRSASGASWDVPSVLQEHPECLQRRPGGPERAPRSTRERAEATRIDAKSHPAVKKSCGPRQSRARSCIVVIFPRFSRVFGFSTKPANP